MILSRGAVVVGEGDGSSCSGFGTSYMKLIDSDNNGQMLSAAHIWEGCNTDPSAQDAHQGGNISGRRQIMTPNQTGLQLHLIQTQVSIRHR